MKRSRGPGDCALLRAVMALAPRQGEKVQWLVDAICHPWNRVLALGWIARHASPAAVVAVAQRALAERSAGEDAYQRVTAAAWPIAALAERGHAEAAAAALQRVLAEAATVTPPSSRSEALFQIYQAAFRLGDAVRQDLVARLADAHAEANCYWRARCNLIHAVAMLHVVDAAAADALLRRLGDPIVERKVRSRLQRYSMQPRAFFW